MPLHYTRTHRDGTKTEIHNPLAKAAIVVLAVIITIWAFFLTVLSLPVHGLIRLCGGRGFVSEDGLIYEIPTWFALIVFAGIALALLT